MEQNKSFNSNNSNLSEKKMIAWVIPYPIKGSGGHRTIIQNVNFLVRNGYECDIYINDDRGANSKSLKRKIETYYGECLAEVQCGNILRKEYDLLFATSRKTTDFVKNAISKRKAYFVQDFEPWFYAMGNSYIATENTYRYGFMTVTIGKWLGNKIQTEFGVPTRSFDFCADLSVYHPLTEFPKERAVCFVYQPEKPRRCDLIGLQALKILKQMRHDVTIYVYGSSSEIDLDLEVTNLHIIPIDECNRLYNKCMAGLCLSASNPSRIPFEMMAAGLPVVELHRENNLYDLPETGTLLSEPTPESIASALIAIIDNQNIQIKMSKAGEEYMKSRPLEHGFTQFLAAVNDMISDNYESYQNLAKTYSDSAFTTSPETKKQLRAYEETNHISHRGTDSHFFKTLRKNGMRKARTFIKRLRAHLPL